MLKALQNFFDHHLTRSESAPGGEADHRLRLATAALFVEMTRVDFEVSEPERERLEQELRQALGLEPDETRELIELAEAEATESVELFQFTRLVDRSFGPQEKVGLVEGLWRLALADHRIDPHEEHLLRKIANLLHVSHRDFIAAKRRARQDARAGEAP